MSPPATIDDRTAARAILDAADAQFYRRGIAGVAMTDIRDEAGVSLRRLYSLYPSKRSLVAAWLADRHERWMGWFGEAIDRHVAGGEPPELAVFSALTEWVGAEGYRGCAFLNTLAEVHEIDDEHRAAVAEHKRAVVDHLRALLLRDHPDVPDWVPFAIGVLLDGAIVQSAVFGTTDPVGAAREAAGVLLQGASA